ncbi:MAG: EamA family transporter [Chloroflexota bacterium]
MLRGILYGATAAAIWGGMYVVSDVVLMVIPPFTLLLLRLILGALSLSVFIISKSPQSLTRTFWLMCIGVGVVGYGISLGAQFVGTDLSTALNGAVVTSATPAFVVIFAVIILRERLTWQRLASVMLATVGVLVIIDLSQVDFSSETFVGNIFLAIAAMTWGLYSVLVRYVNGKYPKIDTLYITLIAFLGGFLLVIPASIHELSRTSIALSDFTVPIILGILFLGVVSTAVAFWLWNTAFTLLDASTASVLFFVQPISGALLGWIFLGQSLTPQIGLGGLLIALGVGLSIQSEQHTISDTQSTEYS